MDEIWDNIWKKRLQSRTFILGATICVFCILVNAVGLIILAVALLGPMTRFEIIGKILTTYLGPINTLTTALMVPYFVGTKAIDGIEKWKNGGKSPVLPGVGPKDGTP